MKFKTVKVSVCLAKDLKNPFFLSQIYSLLSNMPFIFSFSFFSFLFSFKIKSKFSLSTLNLRGLPYSSRKPIVYEPSASI